MLSPKGEGSDFSLSTVDFLDFLVEASIADLAKGFERVGYKVFSDDALVFFHIDKSFLYSKKNKAFSSSVYRIVSSHSKAESAYHMSENLLTVRVYGLPERYVFGNGNTVETHKELYDYFVMDWRDEFAKRYVVRSLLEWYRKERIIAEAAFLRALEVQGFSGYRSSYYRYLRNFDFVIKTIPRTGKLPAEIELVPKARVDFTIVARN